MNNKTQKVKVGKEIQFDWYYKGPIVWMPRADLYFGDPESEAPLIGQVRVCSAPSRIPTWFYSQGEAILVMLFDDNDGEQLVLFIPGSPAQNRKLRQVSRNLCYARQARLKEGAPVELETTNLKAVGRFHNLKWVGTGYLPTSFTLTITVTQTARGG